MRHLRAGDRVAVIAPAGPAEADRLPQVRTLFAQFGLRAHLYPGCQTRHPRHDFLAGDDELRLADLHAAFADADNRGVFCLRGGYGSTRLLGRIDEDMLRRQDKPFVGYSDITALHALRTRLGLIGFHAPMPASDLLLDGAQDDAAALFGVLMRPLGAGQVLAPVLAPGACCVPGVARGRLIGGNLSLIAALAGTPWALDARGAVLFIEEVGETPYRIDRLLTQLRQCGLLETARGFLLGSFTADEDPSALLREHLEPLGKPLLFGWPAGHGRPNRALPLGALVKLDAGAGTLTLEQAVLA